MEKGVNCHGSLWAGKWCKDCPEFGRKCDEMEAGMDDKNRIVFLENRIKALYHNCHAQASFLKADAEEMERVYDYSEKESMIREATAYEVVAGWLNAIIDK